MIQHPLSPLLETCFFYMAMPVYALRDTLMPWLVDANLCAVLKMIVLLNGIYDVVCVWCILFLASGPVQRVARPTQQGPHSAIVRWITGILQTLSNLHAHVWRDPADRDHPLVRRLLAYWIGTYAFVRLLYGLHYQNGCCSSCAQQKHHPQTLAPAAAVFTYLVEAFAYATEACIVGHGRGEGRVVHPLKATFVYSTSLIMAAWLLRCHYLASV